MVIPPPKEATSTDSAGWSTEAFVDRNRRASIQSLLLGTLFFWVAFGSFWLFISERFSSDFFNLEIRFLDFLPMISSDLSKVYLI